MKNRKADINDVMEWAKTEKSRIFWDFLKGEVLPSLRKYTKEEVEDEVEGQVNGYDREIDVLGEKYGMGTILRKVDEYKFGMVVDEEIKHLDYEEPEYLMEEWDGDNGSFGEYDGEYYVKGWIIDELKRFDDHDLRPLFDDLRKLSHFYNLTELEKLNILKTLDKHLPKNLKEAIVDEMGGSEAVELSKCLTIGADLE